MGLRRQHERLLREVASDPLREEMDLLLRQLILELHEVPYSTATPFPSLFVLSRGQLRADGSAFSAGRSQIYLASSLLF
jgi:hypothetical protein